MFDAIKKLFAGTPPADFKELLKKGAVIIDVRTKAEYQNGHIKGSQNIPLNNLSNHYARLKKDQAIITCCASGNRSGQAKRILEANGFKEVYNGGGWMSLQSKIK
jgi:phage shock protein E